MCYPNTGRDFRGCPPYRLRDSRHTSKQVDILIIKLTRCTNISNLFLYEDSTCFGQRNCPKHVESSYKNRFEILVHPVSFIIRIYHYEQSFECQKGRYNFHWFFNRSIINIHYHFSSHSSPRNVPMHPRLYLNESTAPQDDCIIICPHALLFGGSSGSISAQFGPPIPNSFRLTACIMKGCAVRPIAWGRMDVLRNNSWPHSARRKKLCFESYWPPVNYFKLSKIF